MRAGIYAIDDWYFVNADSTTVDGFTVSDVVCVVVHSQHDVEAVGIAVRAACSGSRSGIVADIKQDHRSLGLFRAAGVATWREIEETAQYVAVRARDQWKFLPSQKRYESGEYGFEYMSPSKTVTCDIDATDLELGEAVGQAFALCR